MASTRGLNASDQHPSQGRSGLSDNAQDPHVLEGLRGEDSIASSAAVKGLLPMVEGVLRGRQEAAGWEHSSRGRLGRGQGAAAITGQPKMRDRRHPR